MNSGDVEQNLRGEVSVSCLARSGPALARGQVQPNRLPGVATIPPFAGCRQRVRGIGPRRRVAFQAGSDELGSRFRKVKSPHPGQGRVSFSLREASASLHRSDPYSSTYRTGARLGPNIRDEANEPNCQRLRCVPGSRRSQPGENPELPHPERLCVSRATGTLDAGCDNRQMDEIHPVFEIRIGHMPIMRERTQPAAGAPRAPGCSTIRKATNEPNSALVRHPGATHQIPVQRRRPPRDPVPG